MKELSNALRCDNPDEYETHCHIHLDGSCNGMQHYAAFGRDENGAENVSLTPSEKPGDVYTAILHLVINDINKEIDPKLIEIAESLKNNVTRKVIKQTVMTSVYGVTFIGARQQIQRQLRDKNIYETNGELYRASQYLAKLTIKCIGDLFSDANKIKDWFAKCAKIVAHSNDPVKWITPLGLPCVQPYKRLTNKDIIATVLQNLTIVSNLDEQPVNKNKQNTAFPPNFVHSIDSTHMMYTAMRCRERGITFAAVHDSYW
jgi:DNA-directed RNA polymerase